MYLSFDLFSKRSSLHLSELFPQRWRFSTSTLSLSCSWFLKRTSMFSRRQRSHFFSWQAITIKVNTMLDSPTTTKNNQGSCCGQLQVRSGSSTYPHRWQPLIQFTHKIFILLHIDLFCQFRQCLGHFVEYLDVEGQPVVTYAEFEEEKNWERFCCFSFYPFCGSLVFTHLSGDNKLSWASDANPVVAKSDPTKKPNLKRYSANQSLTCSSGFLFPLPEKCKKGEII